MQLVRRFVASGRKTKEETRTNGSDQITFVEYSTFSEEQFFFFFFLWLHLWHMEVPGLGVELELQLPAYAIAIAVPDPSHICKLCCTL